ncbi:Mth938-like domain-containing protein [Devosia submarina]|uniref:Mth938-like domain-containing protein n=1 Tax=Devosia submarina TaxID=1173082 RepID=UPI000D3777B8|nr:MTH938/NDUFAF3 family protein [Devosia submarina]
MDKPRDVNQSGYYPQQVGIDAYGKGGFRFAGMSHRGSLLCLPTGMHAWPAASPPDITAESLKRVFAAADQIDVLLIGLGPDIAAFPRPLREALRARKIIVEAVSTGGAVRTYNVLLAEERAVAAALLAVESVR